MRNPSISDRFFVRFIGLMCVGSVRSQCSVDLDDRCIFQLVFGSDFACGFGDLIRCLLWIGICVQNGTADEVKKIVSTLNEAEVPSEDVVGTQFDLGDLRIFLT